jgi:hypothetical protein
MQWGVALDAEVGGLVPNKPDNNTAQICVQTSSCQQVLPPESLIGECVRVYFFPIKQNF